MNWAWRQKLKPVPKLVLMALADAADDNGICWPSVATVAAAETDPDVHAMRGWRREVFGADALRLKRGEIALTASSKGVVVAPMPPAQP